MSTKARTIALAVIILAGTIGFWYVRTNYAFTPNAQEAPALSKQAAGAIVLDGTVVPDKTADLGFIISSQITSIPIKVGDTVKAGDILATQEAIDVRAQAAAAQANVQSAQAQLDKLNQLRKKDQLAKHGLSDNAREEQNAQIQSDKSAVESQESALTAAQESVVVAQDQVSKTILRAPFDGIITRQDGQVGEVGGELAPPFMTIATNETPQKIEAYASDLDVAAIHVGNGAMVTFDAGGLQTTVPAKVSAVDPATDSSPGKSTYKVTLLLDQPDANLKAGMHASVAF